MFIEYIEVSQTLGKYEKYIYHSYNISLAHSPHTKRNIFSQKNSIFEENIQEFARVREILNFDTWADLPLNLTLCHIRHRHKRRSASRVKFSQCCSACNIWIIRRVTVARCAWSINSIKKNTPNSISFVLWNTRENYFFNQSWDYELENIEPAMFRLWSSMIVLKSQTVPTVRCHLQHSNELFCIFLHSDSSIVNQFVLRYCSFWCAEKRIRKYKHVNFQPNIIWSNWNLKLFKFSRKTP